MLERHAGAVEHDVSLPGIERVESSERPFPTVHGDVVAHGRVHLISDPPLHLRMPAIDFRDSTINGFCIAHTSLLVPLDCLLDQRL